MKVFFLITLNLLSYLVYSQQKKLPSEYYNKVKLGEEKYRLGDYYDAIPDFEQALKFDPENPALLLKYGICLVESSKDKFKAINALKRAETMGEIKAAFYLGKLFYTTFQFDSASYYWETFKKRADKNEIRKTNVDKLLNQMYDALMLINAPSQVVISPVNMVNSSYPEYSPVTDGENSVLYFTSRRDDTRGGKKDINNNFFEDIYFSNKVEGQWEEVQNPGPPLNSKEHDACIALSLDGSTMIVYKTDPYNGTGDLYTSKKTETGWTKPLKMSMNINSLHEEKSACFSADMKTVYFTSNRPGGYGGFDIYKSTRKKNGVWSLAENLGPSVNTPEDEDTPFISADNKTLFFSSKGHEVNIGGYDIYKSCFKNGKWIKAVNLGWPINTLGDDLFFVLSPDGKNGYMAGLRPPAESVDIYEIKFKYDSSDVTVFKGNIVKENKISFGQIIITVLDRETNEELAVYAPREDNGKFFVVLPNHKELKVVFELNDQYVIEVISPATEYGYREIVKEVDLSNIR